jgi:acyl-coenzyme A thioesterase PaaI-like protein
MTAETDQAAALARLRQEMARPPFHRVLAPQADPATGVVIIRLPYQPHLSRAPDEASYHGGVIATLIDLAGHAAVAVRIGRMAPTITCASTTCVRRTIPI